jgi:hypothetical protein
MACYHPLKAWMTPYMTNSKTGKPFRRVSFKENEHDDFTIRVDLPCGQCVGCRLERSRQWAVRCMHESQMHTQNCFITLTYNNESCPKDFSLNYKHFQDFMKRLRKRYGDKNVKFYMAGEYGESFDRPHYHACIFGLDFEDKKFFRRTETGSILYTSKILEDLWPFGYSTIGDVTFESAAYVARYIMKKVNGDQSSRYEYCDLSTGEIIKRKPEFNKMSLKAPKGSPKGTPGAIGATWFAKYGADIYPHDYVVIRNKKCKPPRYYDNLYSRKFPEEFEMVQFARELEGKSRSADNTLERLNVKEQVVKAKLALLKRTI